MRSASGRRLRRGRLKLSRNATKPSARKKIGPVPRNFLAGMAFYQWNILAQTGNRSRQVRLSSLYCAPPVILR